MTEEEIIEAGIEYTKQFTPEQIDQMEKRTFQRIMNGKPFTFGPKEDVRFDVKFVRTDKAILLDVVDGINLTYWSKNHSAKQITQSLFEMCAVWDIVVKQYSIDKMKARGLEPEQKQVPELDLGTLIVKLMTRLAR